MARIGALNKLNGIGYRRDALWKIDSADKMEGPCYDNTANGCWMIQSPGLSSR